MSGMFEEYKDGNGRVVRRENLFTGALENRNYDENGNCIYQEFSDGKWVRREYDKNNHLCFLENNNGSLMGVPIREKVSSDENSIDIYALERICDNYSTKNILNSLTNEQKIAVYEYVSDDLKNTGGLNIQNDDIQKLDLAIQKELNLPEHWEMENQNSETLEKDIVDDMFE